MKNTDREQAEIMQENIANSELRVVPGAGHMSPLEEPDIVNEMIKD